MPSNKDFGRIPVTIVQIDQDLCCKTWKSTNACGTCNSTGATPCFNTFATCQSIPDYVLTDPLTLSFAKPQSDLPDEIYIIPSLTGVTTSPGRINVGGRSGKDKPLGRRAEITVTFQDHPHSDNFTDPYLDQRTYDPLTLGTFWGKWIKRNPYYQGRSLRLYEGYYGQTIAEMRVRSYIIESVIPPDSNGKVILKAKDILDLADDKKAQAPRLSNGKLLTAITTVSVSMTVTAAAITEYDSYPTMIVRIGAELIRYTGLTTDINDDLVFTGLIRGVENTVATTHDIDDSVQACLEYVGERPDTVAYDLITTYGNIAPSQVDLTGWAEEAEIWLATYSVTRVITEPIGVTTLLGELSEQSLFYMWWDEYASLVRLRVIHPPTTAVPLITEENNLIQNSVSIKAQVDLRASEIWVSYSPITPLDIKDSRDYTKTKAQIDPTAESPFAYGERRVYRVLSAWLQSEAIIAQLTNRLLSRYIEPPLFLYFALDAKDNDLGMGDVFDISYSGFVDETGAIELLRYQVISAHEIDGTVVKYEAQKFDFAIDEGLGFYTPEIYPDYIDATESERDLGCYWGETDGTMPNGDSGYKYI